MATGHPKSADPWWTGHSASTTADLVGQRCEVCGRNASGAVTPGLHPVVLAPEITSALFSAFVCANDTAEPTAAERFCLDGDVAIHPAFRPVERCAPADEVVAVGGCRRSRNWTTRRSSSPTAGTCEGDQLARHPRHAQDERGVEKPQRGWHGLCFGFVADSPQTSGTRSHAALPTTWSMTSAQWANYVSVHTATQLGSDTDRVCAVRRC
jgi:hypothetical protein